MKTNAFPLSILAVLLCGSGLLEAQPLLPNPVYGLQAAINWDISGTNGVPYGGTTPVGFMEGVPSYYSWYYTATPVLLPWTQPNSTAVHCYDQIYKVGGSGIHPDCRVELGPMHFMCHVIATGQWTNMTDEVIGGAAFVEDFYNNESTGGDVQSLSNSVISVRAGIGNAQPTTSGSAGGTDSRGVGYLFHGFPADQPQLLLSSVDAVLGYQQMRVVGPDAVYTPYICNLGLDYGEENGISGGRFVPSTTNWQWITCYAGNTNLISTVPQTNVSFVFASGLTLSQTSASIAGGASLQLTATIAPTNASDQGLIWTTSNPGVAFVGINGLVTGFGSGTPTITATSQDNPSLTASCLVTVTNSPLYTIVNAGNVSDGITYGGDGFFNLRLGDVNGDESFLVDSSCYAQYTFTGTGVGILGFLPGGPQFAANYTIYVDGDVVATGNTSATSDTYLAQLGGVTGLSFGSHIVKVAFASGIGSSPLVILDALQIYNGGQNVPVTGVTVSPNSATLNVGGSTQLTAAVRPNDATNKRVTWSSSNPNVLIVNELGQLGGVSDGAATVKVTTQDGNYSDTSMISVTGSSSPIVNAGTSSDGILYSGGWFNIRSGDINNDERMMNNSSCYAQYTFYGDGVDVIGFLPGGSNYAAYYTIFVDGTPAISGNTTSTIDQFQVLLGSVTNLSNGVHTVKLAFVSGIGSSAYVILDAFRIHTALMPPFIASVSMAQNGTSFTVAGVGAANQSYVLLTASNLLSRVMWEAVQTNVASVSGAFSFTDFETTNFSQRFYRIQQGQ